VASEVEYRADYPPPGMEISLIEQFVPIGGRRILEIGSGDGRLTRQLARVASEVVAVEPDAERATHGLRIAATEGLTNISFQVGSAEHLRIRGRPFDVVLFSWSL
jgi:ubiquinone/menaquinone biosynthesis C-methylase UbiE